MKSAEKSHFFISVCSPIAIDQSYLSWILLHKDKLWKLQKGDVFSKKQSPNPWLLSDNNASSILSAY